MSLLNDFGVDKEAFEEAKSTTVAEAYEAWASGVYDATIHTMVKYNSSFVPKDSKDKKEVTVTQLRIEVEAKNEDGATRIIGFRSDIGAKLKDGTDNQGFLSRLKSICEATNFKIEDFGYGEEVEVDSFGKKVKATKITGVLGKPVKVLVRHSNNTNVPEGEQFKYSNDIEGITAEGNEDIELFNEKVEKAVDGIFGFKGYYKAPANAGNAAGGNKEAKDAAKKHGF